LRSGRFNGGYFESEFRVGLLAQGNGRAEKYGGTHMERHGISLKMIWTHDPDECVEPSENDSWAGFVTAAWMCSGRHSHPFTRFWTVDGVFVH
jgi:hypothetical protein